LALCTVAEPSVVLGEIRRVLKTGGRLLLLEHVCSSHRWLAQLQNWLNPAWHRVVKGCNLNRHTPQTLQDAGFRAIYTRQILADFLLFGIYEA
jgi:ubiquinone/menaquinone biosynthesis C-methylase UbiE